MNESKPCPHCGAMLSIAKQLEIDSYKNRIRQHEPIIDRKTLELITQAPKK